MKTKRWWIIGGCIVALILLGVTAFSILLPGNLVVGSLNDREVWGRTTNRRGPCQFLTEGATATVQLGRQSARVTADAIEFPGGRTVKIPATCKKIELFETRNGMRILFDGSEQK